MSARRDKPHAEGRPAGKRARKRSEPAARRRQLVNATLTSIARHGLDGCSIQAISKSAGVSRGLIHHYYRDKDELLCDAYRTLGEDMMTVFRELAGSDAPPMSRLEAVVRAAFSLPVSSARNCSAWLGFWHASRNNPRLLAINRAVYAEYRLLLKELVDEAARAQDAYVDTDEVVLTLMRVMDGAWIELAIDPSTEVPESTALGYLRLVVNGSRAAQDPQTGSSE